MTCPVCGGDIIIINSRKPRADRVRRRRECTACGHRFTTWEITDTTLKRLEAKKHVPIGTRH